MGVEPAGESVERRLKGTELQVIRDLNRIYWGAVLARNLRIIGEKTLQRMGVLLELTEGLYQRGSGRVKKTDYLQNKIIVESLRSMVSTLQTHETEAVSALSLVMGLDAVTVVPDTDSIPYNPLSCPPRARAGRVVYGHLRR